MALGKMVSRQKSRGSIRNLISEKLSSSTEVQYITKESWLRASSMYRICPREEALASLLKVIRYDKINASLQLIFEHGHALHHQLQNSILPRLGILYGQWRCNRCSTDHGTWERPDTAHLTLVLRPEECSNCGYDTFTYQEIHFEDESIRISGHPDGFLVVPGRPGAGVLEGKSIGQRGALQVKHAPLFGHVIQCQTYMMLTGLRWAKILYWQKAANGIDALIEHTVEYDQPTVDKIRGMVSSIWRALETGELPDRICATNTCDRAKECGLSGPCFDYGEQERLSIVK